LLNLAPGDGVLAVAPHRDDETLEAEAAGAAIGTSPAGRFAAYRIARHQ
jgi:hypothetical protein